MLCFEMVVLVLCIINVIGSLFVFLFGILIIVVFWMLGWEIRRVLSLVGGIWEKERCKFGVYEWCKLLLVKVMSLWCECE